MGTLVNGSSLEECSLIRSNDKIRPYFAVSVVNDPDLIGLLVYMQDSQGKIIGDKLQYTLLPYASETALTETDLQEQEAAELAELDEADDPVSEANDDIDDEAESAEPIIVEKNTDVEVAVKSLAQELPYFPLPKEMEIGPYVLVFEVLGKKETLSRTETNVFYLDSAEFHLKDISMYLPGLSGPQLISPETVIMLETTLDFDRRLDPYVVWYNGKTVISEGKISAGAGNFLWKAPEQAGFYSLRLEAFPFHLKRNTYAGISREIALPVSPKAISLGHFFEFENSQEYAARSPLSAGTAYPEQVKLLAAMADEDSPREGMPASYPAPELLQWYQFEGDLRDSLSTLINEKFLLPANESRPRWAAAGQSYGLAVGPDNPYLLPPVNFFREKQEQGGGILLSHIRPLSEGIIFNAFFPLRSSSTEGVRVNMIKEGNVIALRLSAADTFVDLPIYLPVSAAEGLIPIAVEFYIRPYRLEAKISLDGHLQNRTGSIKLPGALSGEGRIRLGGAIDKSILEKSILDKSILDKSILEQGALVALTSDGAESQPEETSAYIPAVVETHLDTVWDELAILFSAVPLLPEKPLETDAEEDAAAYAAKTQHEAESADIKSVDIKPVDTKPVDTKSADVKSVEADTDADNSAQEQETQERAPLTVLSENL